ncbi:MAG: 6-bladed beta-propeller [Gemmatimonas sp.]
MGIGGRLLGAMLGITMALATATMTAQPSPVVRVAGAPVWGASVRLAEEVRIGVADGDEEYMFGMVSGVGVGERGAIVVGDYQVPVVRMYDAQGKFLRNVGRRGEGPGEYRTVFLRAFRDGRIAVWDHRIQRLTYYSAAGETPSSIRVPSGLLSADLFRVDRHGFAYVRTALLGSAAVSENWPFGWIRVSPAGKVIDTIVVPRDPKPDDSWVSPTPAGYDRPFTRALLTTLSGDGALVVGENRSTGASYSFELRKPGAPVIRVERAYTPVPLNDEEFRQWTASARYIENSARAPITSNRMVQQAPPRARHYNIPRVKPAYSEFRTDIDGRVWVRRYVTAVKRASAERAKGDNRPQRTWREQPTYDVFEADGRFMGTIVLPWNASFEEASGTAVYITLEGADGEEIVARYRIVPGAK